MLYVRKFFHAIKVCGINFVEGRNKLALSGIILLGFYFIISGFIRLLPQGYEAATLGAIGSLSVWLIFPVAVWIIDSQRTPNRIGRILERHPIPV